jgi:hypothetical protein
MAYYLSEGNNEMVRILKERNAQDLKTSVLEPRAGESARGARWGDEFHKDPKPIIHEAKVGIKSGEETTPKAPHVVDSAASAGTIRLVEAKELPKTQAQPSKEIQHRGNSPAKASSNSLPTDATGLSAKRERFRMVILCCLPHDVSHTQLQGIIRGGPILGVRVIAGYPYSHAEIVFINGLHANAYYDWMTTGPVRFGNQQIVAKLDKGPSINKDERNTLSKKDISRVLMVKPIDVKNHTLYMIKDIAGMIPICAKRLYSSVDVTQTINPPAYKVKFSHLRDALEAEAQFKELGFKTLFLKDVCTGSLSELPKSRTVSLTPWKE